MGVDGRDRRLLEVARLFMNDGQGPSEHFEGGVADVAVVVVAVILERAERLQIVDNHLIVGGGIERRRWRNGRGRIVIGIRAQIPIVVQQERVGRQIDPLRTTRSQRD